MSVQSVRSLLANVEKHGARTALSDENGEYSYHRLFSSAKSIGSGLLNGRIDLNEERVLFQVPPGFQYAATLLGIWSAGGIAVPAGLGYPERELEYILADCGAETVVADQPYLDRIRSLASRSKVRLLSTNQLIEAPVTRQPRLASERGAMILYTSGTTSQPKGVLTTHGNISAQVRSLVQAWGWVPDDLTLNVLPLHHVHGIINVVASSLWVGAHCRMLPKFQAEQVFDLISGGDLTLFMAVPTIYSKLIGYWEGCTIREQRKFSRACKKMRLMVSGSAALPVQVLERWKGITGHTLLERYGMTEIGMALSNPLRGMRRPGYVGEPLPGVHVRLIGENGEVIVEDQVPGEICVKGETVFCEYWNREQETKEMFQDSWFRTGDIALRDRGSYRILGRNSVDIIKSGGYKVSALETEEVLRMHPAIRECAVVGIPDRQWGERVAAAVLLKTGQNLELEELRQWASNKLAVQKIPTFLLLMDELPRNAMGKVVKPEVRRCIEDQIEGC